MVGYLFSIFAVGNEGINTLSFNRNDLFLLKFEVQLKCNSLFKIICQLGVHFFSIFIINPESSSTCSNLMWTKI